MPKSKVSAFLSVLLVFASGAAMGAVAYRLYVVKSVASSVPTSNNKKKMSPEDFRKATVALLKDAVRLDDQQLEEVNKIYAWQGDQFMQDRKKYQAQIDQIHQESEHEGDQIHEAAVAKLKAILRPEQQPLYDKWLADRAAARAADRKRHQLQQQQQGPGGPGPGQHGDNHRPPGPYPQP